MKSPLPGKVFGVALDASDDPFSLDLKHAAMQAQEYGIEGLLVDPYDALSEELARRTMLEPVGKFPVPSCLGALPRPSDRDLVTAEAMQQFVDQGGVLRMIDDLKGLVAREILPALPVMVGIDHAATGGVIAAITERLGAENLSIVVLDRHFDALPLSVRMAPFGDAGHGSPGSLGMVPGNDACCCGNFWAHLIEHGMVDPTHLVFVGVADYPPEATPPEWTQFRENYLAYEKQGCRFFPLRAFNEGRYAESLRQLLTEAITTPYVYVSLDLDVGAYNAVHAARYMDGPGIDTEAIMQVARLIAAGCRSGRYRLAGLDVMEFNMHLLGLRTEGGVEDRTTEIALAFIETLAGRKAG